MNVTSQTNYGGPGCDRTAIYLAIGSGVLAIISELLGALPPDKCPNGLVHGLQQLARYVSRGAGGDARAQVAGLPI